MYFIIRLNLLFNKISFMIDDFSKNGYYLKKTIFSKSLINLYESEFDKIVHQLKKSREDINARWGSKLTSNIEPDDSLLFILIMSRAILRSCSR